MISAGVNNAKGVSAGCKIKIDLIDNGIRRILEINCNKAADRACRLIKKSAGLAEVLVLGILSNLRNLDRRNLAVIVKMIKNCSDQNLVSRRGRKTRSRKHTAHTCY